MLSLVNNTETNAEFINRLQRTAMDNKRTSNRYAFVDTNQLIASVSQTVETAGYSHSTALIRGRGRKGTMHAVEVTFNSKTLQVLGDDCKPRIIVKNSFNGESPLVIMVGLMRLVCSNGLIAGREMFSERVIHVKGQTLDGKLAALNDKVISAVKFIENDFAAKVESSMTAQLTLDAEYRVIDSLHLSKRITDKVKELRSWSGIPTLRESDQPRTAWALYNVVNETVKDYARTEMGNLRANVGLMDRVIESVKLAA